MRFGKISEFEFSGESFALPEQWREPAIVFFAIADGKGPRLDFDSDFTVQIPPGTRFLTVIMESPQVTAEKRAAFDRLFLTDGSDSA